MCQTLALGRRRWSACQPFARSRNGQRRRISSDRACWTPNWWTSSICRCSVRSCCAIRWRDSIKPRRQWRWSAEAPWRCLHPPHRRLCCCHRRRRRGDVRAPSSPAATCSNRASPQRQAGPATTYQCAASDGASSRFTNRGWSVKWRLIRKRLSKLRGRRPVLRWRRSTRPSNGTPMLEGSTITITGRWYSEMNARDHD